MTAFTFGCRAKALPWFYSNPTRNQQAQQTSEQQRNTAPEISNSLLRSRVCADCKARSVTHGNINELIHHNARGCIGGLRVWVSDLPKFSKLP